MNILIIEDEFNLADAIKSMLKKENYIIKICTNGTEGEDEALSGIYDLILLDVMLPGKNGFEILKSIRKENINSKVIMLTAKANIDDKMEGFNEGANDYLTKPFHMDELFARIKLQLSDGKIKNELATYGDLSLDTHKLILENTNTKETINIIGKEYNILLILLNSHESIISKEQLFSKVWGYDSDSEINTLEAYMSFIRKKLKNINIILVVISVFVSVFLTSELSIKISELLSVKAYEYFAL